MINPDTGPTPGQAAYIHGLQCELQDEIARDLGEDFDLADNR